MFQINVLRIPQRYKHVKGAVRMDVRVTYFFFRMTLVFDRPGCNITWGMKSKCTKGSEIPPKKCKIIFVRPLLEDTEEASQITSRH